MNIIQTNSYIKLMTKNAKCEGKLAIFDLDCTLIKPDTGKTPRNHYKLYKYCHSNIIQKINELVKYGYQIIIITNQKVLKTNDNKNEWIEKINKLQSELCCELIVYGSLLDDIYRKPRLGFLEFIKPDSKSFYCGDALGRENDFSDSDIKLSMNLNIKCLTPEFVFENNIKLNIYDIPNIINNYAPIFNLHYYKTFKYINTYANKEVIIMVGIQGSGKSLISKWIKQLNSFITYDIISRDNLKTMKKCLNNMEFSLKSGYNCIIDNTNPSEEARKPYITLAKKYNYKIKIINIHKPEKDLAIALHNTYYRHIKFNMPLIPKIALYKFCKSYQYPTKTIEKFDELIELDYFLPTLDLDYFKFIY